MATFNTDRSFFLAYNDCGKFGMEAVVDPSMTRGELVENMRRGELGYDDVVAVHEYNPSEGWSRDISEDIFSEVDAAAQRLQDREDWPVTTRALDAAE